MYTLQEFLMYTKAFEYVIAIAFIIAFIVFWSLLTRQRPAPEKFGGEAETSRAVDDEEIPKQF